MLQFLLFCFILSLYFQIYDLKLEENKLDINHPSKEEKSRVCINIDYYF